MNPRTIKKISSRGFTLIELLVVIAIIGLLSTLAIVALGSARMKSRDARRLADVKQIQTALEMYNNETGSYPVSTSSILLGDTNHACLGSNGFNAKGACENQYIILPKDPSGRNYLYSSDSGLDYSVSANLEGETNGMSGPIAVKTNAGLIDNEYGLVGWWKFDDGNTTTLTDSSGHGNNGQWYGSGTHSVGGKIGGAGQFNGVDDYVMINTSTSLTLPGNNESIIMWAKHASNNLFFQNNSWSRRFFRSSTAFYDNQGHLVYVGLGFVSDNQWHQLAYTFKDRVAKNYVDGIPVDSVLFVADLRVSSGYWWFGRVCAGSIQPLCEQWYNGLLDDIRIYNRALSPDEIKALYDSQNY